MKEIKVNDYVRTKYGIRLIETIEDGFYYIDRKIPFKYLDVTTWSKALKRSEILKYSENIMDLIEIGDVLELQEENGDIVYMGWKKDIPTLTYKEMLEEIKNGELKLLGIVTRQQFNSIKYEVE